MPDPNKIYLNCNFNITIKEGDFRVSKVRNIERVAPYETIIEGGHGGRLLPKQPQRAKQLIFERGYCDEKTALDADKLLGIPHPNDPMSIQVFDRNRKKVKTYEVNNWMIVKWSLGELNALTGAVLLETVEVAYTSLIDKGVKEL